MQRLPPGKAYDENMKVFVADMETHDAYRRGRAVDRQDKTGSFDSSSATHKVIEESEEIRLLCCRSLGVLIRRVCSMGSASILHPYFHEIVIFLQTHLHVSIL